MSPAVTVEVRDQYGNRVTSSVAPVGLAFGNNAGGGTLSGGGALAAASGLATFGGLSVNKTGTGYTLSATSGLLTAATSSAFNVTAGAAATIALNGGDNQSATVATIAPAVNSRLAVMAILSATSGVNYSR